MNPESIEKNDRSESLTDLRIIKLAEQIADAKMQLLDKALPQTEAVSMHRKISQFEAQIKILENELYGMHNKTKSGEQYHQRAT